MSTNFTRSLLVWTFAAWGAIGAIASGEETQANVHRPFNGKDLSGWKLKGTAEQSKWVVGKAVMNLDAPTTFDVTVIAPDAVTDVNRQLVNSGHAGVDIYTEEKYGDCTIEL
ncbi:MAG: hypothetical protein ABI614_20120, partial [Planctomycetota bacterium]